MNQSLQMNQMNQMNPVLFQQQMIHQMQYRQPTNYNASFNQQQRGGGQAGYNKGNRGKKHDEPDHVDKQPLPQEASVDEE